MRFIGFLGEKINMWKAFGDSVDVSKARNQKHEA